MIFLAIVAIIYGALAAMYFVVKKDGDVKKLVAYSSVSSMGIVMLGLFALNPNGSERRRDADDQSRNLFRRAVPAGRHHLRATSHAQRFRVWRAVARDARLRGGVSWSMAMTAIGLPLLACSSQNSWRCAARSRRIRCGPRWGALGIILNAGYMLWLYQRMFFGEIENRKEQTAAGSERARMGLHDAAGHHVVVDWSLSQRRSCVTSKRPVNAVVKQVRPNLSDYRVSAARPSASQPTRFRKSSKQPSTINH